MKNRAVTALTIVMCSFMLLSSAMTAVGDERLLQRGMDAYRKQKYAKTSAFLATYYNNHLLECTGQECRKAQVDVAMALGECHYRTNSPALARLWFEVVPNRYGDDAGVSAMAVYWLGKCESLECNYDKAIEVWESILISYGDEKYACAKARIALSNLYLGHRQDSVAATDILRPLLHDDVVNNSGELLEELGWRLWTLNEKSKETRQTLDKLLEFAKNNWRPDDYALLRVRVASSMGDHSLAIEEAEKAMSETDDALLNARFSRLRADALRHLGRTAESMEAYDDIVARFGKKTDRITRSIVSSALLQSATALREMGQTEEAKGRLQKLPRDFPDMADTAQNHLNLLDPDYDWRKSDKEALLIAPDEIILAETDTIPLRLEVKNPDGRPFSGVIKLWADWGVITSSSRSGDAEPSSHLEVQVDDGSAEASLSLEGRDIWSRPLQIYATLDDKILANAEVKIRYDEHINLSRLEPWVPADGITRPGLVVEVLCQYGKPLRGVEVDTDLEVVSLGKVERVRLHGRTSTDGKVLLSLPPRALPGYMPVQVIAPRMNNVIYMLYMDEQPQMVSLRDAVAEYAEYKNLMLSWDSDSKTALVRSPGRHGRSIKVRAGEDHIERNGRPLPIGAKAQIVDGSLQVPEVLADDLLWLL